MASTTFLRTSTPLSNASLAFTPTNTPTAICAALTTTSFNMINHPFVICLSSIKGAVNIAKKKRLRGY